MKTPTKLAKGLAVLLLVNVTAAAWAGESPGSGNANNGQGNAHAYGSDKKGEKPEAGDIANACAADSGGDAKRYTAYAKNLAETLARLTPEQRARIFGGGGDD